MLNHNDKLLNQAFCSEILKVQNIKLKSAYCIGHSPNYPNGKMEIYISDSSRKKKPLPQPKGQSLFLLKFKCPAEIVQHHKMLNEQYGVRLLSKELKNGFKVAVYLLVNVMSLIWLRMIF
ncbi:DUF3023 domain-containing protein [Ehrlichia sp. JZT12]